MNINDYFEVISESIKEFSHIKSGLPNQDSVIVSNSLDGNLIIACVADGHGSSTCFRSNIGSKIAVEVSKVIILELLTKSSIIDDSTLEETRLLRTYLDKDFCKQLIIAWKNAIDNDLNNNPFMEEELNKLKNEKGEKSLERLENNKYLAYGTTILGCVIHPKFIFSFQLGDGDSLYMDEDNNIDYIIQKDPELIANETTSLCSDNAEKKFNLSFQFIQDKFPKMISLSTDGYYNSFVNQDECKKSFKDYYNIYKEEGLSAISENIDEWLNEVSQKGSGDDITLVLIFNKIQR